LRYQWLAGLVVAGAGLLEGASIKVYMAAPGIVDNPIGGATVETFNGFSTGNYVTDLATSVGTFSLDATHKLMVHASDNYGGANTSNYAVFGAQNSSSAPVTLNVGSPQKYFGFWWSAGDSRNGLSFYLAGVLLARFSTADLVTILTPSTVTAIDGTSYARNLYYGKPPARTNNAGEPYAYVMFVMDNTMYDRIVFDNSGLSNSGFEMDNMAILNQTVTVPVKSVFVKSVSSAVETPEPGTVGLAAAGLAGLAILRRGSRRGSARG